MLSSAPMDGCFPFYGSLSPCRFLRSEVDAFSRPPLGQRASDREAHRAAVDWLNANMNDAFNFFAVEVEAWEIGASRPSGHVALSPS